MADESQEISVINKNIIWLLLIKKHNVLINTFRMPVHSSNLVEDTYCKYKLDTVSYKFDYREFEEDRYLRGCNSKFVYPRLTNAKKIDERNLVFCRELDLSSSTVTELDTAWLGSL